MDIFEKRREAKLVKKQWRIFVAGITVIILSTGYLVYSYTQKEQAQAQSNLLSSLSGFFSLIDPVSRSVESTLESISEVTSSVSTESQNSAPTNPSSIQKPPESSYAPPATTPSVPPAPLSGNRIMVFRSIPYEQTMAQEYAQGDLAMYRKFANNGWVPLVVLEPDTAAPSQFGTASFWNAVRTYYQTLKDSGITSKQLGEQIIFSEANTHQVWGGQINPNASSYKSNLQKYINTMKSVYSDGHAAALLDGFTFAVNDEEWNNPSELNIEAYLGGISGLNTFYIQGFTWLSPTNPSRDRRDAFEYTHLETLKKYLYVLNAGGVTPGVNTGAMVAQNRGFRTLTPDQVKAQVEGILGAVTQFQNTTGKKLKVNIFSENKLGVAEGKDWNFPVFLGEEYYQEWIRRLVATGALFSEFRYGQ